MPLFSTTTQFVALALVLIAGWLFGLASHPGGKKWKARYLAERDANAAARKDGDVRATTAEKRVAELERENARLAKDGDGRAAAAEKRVAELERERDTARTTQTVPVAASSIAPTRAAVQSQSSTRPAYAAGERRGWFDFGR